MEIELRDAVVEAAGRTDVCQAVAEVYAALAGAIEARRPVCIASGRCCRFEEFGHRLYVTTMELARFVSDRRANGNRNADGGTGPRDEESGFSENLRTGVGSRDAGPEIVLKTQAGVASALLAGRSLPVIAPAKPWDGTGCPFQVEGLCGVHAIRPFGCRIFFCDATSTEWQHEQYERLHAQLRRRHNELNVPYFYVEWRFALQALGLTWSKI